jgi:hypothetical protein
MLQATFGWPFLFIGLDNNLLLWYIYTINKTAGDLSMSAKNIIHNVDQKDLMKLAIGWYCDQIGCNVFEFIGDEEGDIASPVEDVVSQVLGDIDDIR